MKKDARNKKKNRNPAIKMEKHKDGTFSTLKKPFHRRREEMQIGQVK
jgi:hypothetical protein